MYNLFRKTNVLGRCVFNGDATQVEQTTSTNLYINCYIRIRRYILFLVTPIILFSLISCTLDVASTDDESPTSPPSSSSSVTAKGLSSNYVSISWDSVLGATYYQVYSSTGLLVATVFLPVTNYIVTGLLPNTEYIYHVRACNVSGCSDLTSVSATTETPPIINGTAEVPPIIDVTAEVPPVINVTAEVSPVINVTAEVPTIISNAAELAAIGTNSSTLSGDYILTGNIDLSTISNWRPIGDNPSNGFTGSFDGNGYSISGLSSSGYEYAGLFGYVKDAYISNIGVIAGNISSSNTFASSAGGLVGYAYYSDISNSYAVVTDDISAYDGGGLVGYAYYSDISNSYAMVADDISAYDNYGSSAGGLVGKFNDSKISNSYAVVAGDISASDDYGSLAGGLIGYFVYSFISVDYVNKGAPVSNSYYSASREYSQGSFSNSFGTYQTVDELRALTAVSTGWDGAIWNFGTDADLPMLVATPLTVPLPSIFHE